MTGRADVVREAVALVDTPYQHQGRVPGPSGGIDCVGVPVLIAWALELKPRSWNVTGYRRIPDGYSLMTRLRAEMGPEIDREHIKPGDLIVLDWGQFPHHVAVVGEYHLGGLSMIHADNVQRKVIQHRLVIGAPARFVTAFQFPGVTDV